MASILLKLTIQLAGKKGTLRAFLNSSKQHFTKDRNVIFAVSYVQDQDEFNRLFTSTNRSLLDWIRIHKPNSIYSMAKILKKDVSNLQKILNELARFSLVRLELVKTKRRTIKPIVDWTQIEVLFPETIIRKAA